MISLIRRPKPARGFTLIEVILAVAIFVGAIVLLSRLVIIGVENAEHAEWEAEAWLIAETRWAELESGIRSLSESGPFDVEEMPGWQWGINVESTGVPDLVRVTLIVERPNQIAAVPPYSVQLTRLFFDDTANQEEATSTR